jgi:hypothetical protein
MAQNFNQSTVDSEEDFDLGTVIEITYPDTPPSYDPTAPEGGDGTETYPGGGVTTPTPPAGWNAEAYLQANPDVAAAGVDPLRHYLDYGQAEGRPLTPSPEPTPSPSGFDGAAYLAANPDVAAAGLDPLYHWETYGQFEGRQLRPTTPSKPKAPAPPAADVVYSANDQTYNINFDDSLQYTKDQYNQINELLSSGNVELPSTGGTYNFDTDIIQQLYQAQQQYPDQKMLLSEEYGLLVDAPPSIYSFMAEDFGPAFANSILGNLGGQVAGTVAFDVFGAPIDPTGIAPNIVYQGGKAAGTGALFGKSTFEAKVWQDPTTGEPIVQQTLNIGGEPAKTLFTSETEFQQKRQEELALQEKYNTADYLPLPTNIKKEVTGKENPSWQDYVNTDFDLGQVVFDSLTGSQTLTELPESTQDMVMLGTKLAQGDDPLTALIDVYGDDVADTLGLEKIANDSIDAMFDPQVAEWIKSNHELAKIGADVVVRGQDLSESIANRFGSQILDKLNADTPNQKAFGIAGLDFAVNLDKGMDLGQATGEALYDYFDNGGRIPDLFAETSMDASFEFPEFTIPNPFKDLFPEINFELPDMIDLSAISIPWKDISNNLKVKFPELPNWQLTDDLLEIGFEIPDLIDIGFTLPDFNLPEIIGVDVDFEGIDLEGLADLNLDLQLPQIDLLLGQFGQGPSEYTSLDMDTDLAGFDFQIEEKEDEIPLSRRVLESV